MVFPEFSMNPNPSEWPVLKHLLPQELSELFVRWGLKPYRVTQVLSWIYKRQSLDFQEMTDISKQDRSTLANICRIGQLGLLNTQRAADGTEKWLLELEDGMRVETVLIPEQDHLTQCISTQVGCSMGCSFCRTSLMGLRRQLRTWEIVEQVVMGRRLMPGEKIRNVVLMGMGEPLANYQEVVRAVKIMLDRRALDLSKRRITLSTCGLIPQIRRLASEGLGISLAVSLNATTEDQRSRIMPINKIHPMGELLRACRELSLPARSRITFEYVMLGGFNDSVADARRLVKLLQGIKCKVNLIPHNPYPGSSFRRPRQERIIEFQRILANSGITAPIRWSHGSDISAACGQLAASEQDMA